MKSVLETTVEGFYEDLNKNEEKATRTLARGYQRSIDALEGEMRRIEEGISAVGLVGDKAFQYNRMAALVTEAGNAFSELGDSVGLVLSESQQVAVALAEQHVKNVLAISPTGIPKSFSTLPKGAITQMVGSLGDGSPLRALTDSFAGSAAKTVNKLLLEGVALGRNPNDTARRISEEMQGGLVRAKTIARTETMRVYREASRRSMIANKDVVKGWTWFSALDKRTCPVCWAMHGKKFRLNESMATHPNCRCTLVPDTYTWKELGFNIDEATDPRFAPGETQFTFLDDGDKRFILGKGGFTAWSNKLVTLDDFVLDTFSPQWGYGRTQKPLSRMVGPDNAKLLTQGKVPANFNPKQFVYDPPNFADPFNLQKIKLDDALATGKIDATQAADIRKALQEGGFIEPGAMDQAIQLAIEQPFTTVEELSNAAFDLGAISESTWKNILDTLVEGDASKLPGIQLQLELDIAEKKKEIEYLFELKKQNTIAELDKAKSFGNLNPTDYDFFVQNINGAPYSPQLEGSLDALFDTWTKKNSANNPFTQMKGVLDEAKLKGLISDQHYADYIGLADQGQLTVADAKSIQNVFEKKIAQNEPIFGSPLTYAPEDWKKVTNLVNEGKLTVQEYDALYDSFEGGNFTPKGFTDHVDDLVTKLNAPVKSTKSSFELLNELENSHYPTAYKQQITQSYKQKLINKEQMQDILNKAPSTPPKLKTPYKKLQNEMAALKNQGIINQQYIDQLMNGYANGLYKNADIERMLEARANNFVKGVRSVSHMPHPRDFRQSWDSQGFIGSGYRGQGGRGHSFYNEWSKANPGTHTGSITDYTNSLFDELNKWLRMGQPDDKEWKAASSYRTYTASQLRKKMLEIDEALTTVSTPEDMVVIRNSRASLTHAPDWADPSHGAIIWDDGYMSTSAKSDWSSFTKCSDTYTSKVAFQLVLNIPAGSRALYVAPISSHSEYEVMIQRGEKIEIVEVEDITDYCGNPAKRIYATLISP